MGHRDSVATVMPVDSDNSLLQGPELAQSAAAAAAVADATDSEWSL